MAAPDQPHPKTLLAMAGAPAWETPLPGQAAVLLIDAQEEYRSGALALDDAEAALIEIARLRRHAYDLSLPVIHVRHAGRPGGLFDLQETGGTFCEEAEPLPDEPVVTKALPNAFAGTDLAEILARQNIRRLVVAGFMTHMCVSSTVRAALDLGLSSGVVANACATRALPAHDGSVVSARDLHKASLAALADRFAHILPDVTAV